MRSPASCRKDRVDRWLNLKSAIPFRGRRTDKASTLAGLALLCPLVQLSSRWTSLPAAVDPEPLIGILQALVEEALADLIEKHKNAKPRVHVMGAYLASHEKLGPPYIRDHGLARWKRGVGEKPCEGFAPTGPA